MLGYVLSAILGFAFGILLPHLRNIVHDVISPSHDLKAVWGGVMKSLRGTLIVIVIILSSLVGAYLYDQAQNRATAEVIKQIVEEANQPLRDDIQSLIKEIRQERNERK